jgi:hypothetical protein
MLLGGGIVTGHRCDATGRAGGLSRFAVAAKTVVVQLQHRPAQVLLHHSLSVRS